MQRGLQNVNFLSAMLSTAVVTRSPWSVERTALPGSYDEVASGLLVMLSIVMQWAWGTPGQLSTGGGRIWSPTVAMFHVPKSANGLVAVPSARQCGSCGEPGFGMRSESWFRNAGFNNAPEGL